MFYEELSKEYGYWTIIAVLGNHELWNMDTSDPEHSLESIIQKYDAMFRKLKIVFLHNTLFVCKNGKCIVAQEEDLIAADPDEIRDLCVDCSPIIFGGTGFSGKNKVFNFNTGIYKNSIKNREEEENESRKFERTYETIRESISDLRVIVLSHMPVEDWTDSDCQSNWIYVNGHTHENYFIYNNDRTVFSDNQIGYDSSSIFLKYFDLEDTFDSFRYVPDGIHEITRNQYTKFYQGLGLKVNFHRTNNVYMLKRKEYYCFFIRQGNRPLLILNGGGVSVAEVDDLNYYYDNMIRFSEIVNDYLKEYNSELEKISDAVKSIGGNGTIHGCIVDIDYLDHIFLNPFDRKMTAYYADDIVSKKIYKNVPSLLYCENKELYNNYQKCIEQDNTKGNSIKIICKSDEIIKKYSTYTRTDIYKISRIIKNYQYLTNSHIIRKWDNRLLRQNNKKELSKFIRELIEGANSE